MKGDRKRSKNCFKPGHIPHNKGKTMDKKSLETEAEPQSPSWTRVMPEKFALETRTSADGRSYSVPDVDGKPGSTRYLRPKSNTGKNSSNLQKKGKTTDDGTRLVKMYLIVDMMNSIYFLHRLQDAECDGLNVTINKETKYGWGWKYMWKCTACKFVSPSYNTYEEIKQRNRGPNHAAWNRTFQMALQHTPMGNRRARILFAGGLDVPPPTKKTMQRHANIVSKQMKELNDKDMKKKAEIVRSVNEARGVENPSHISVATDTRYNSMHIVSTKIPGQNASQAVTLACEQVTERKFIVAAVFHNKLCWTGAWLINKGLSVTCPDGHSGVCTANVKSSVPLSEYLMGKEIGTQLEMQGILVKYAVTDGDGRAAQGIIDALQVLHPMWKVERLADPTHLGRSQLRQCNSARFSCTMFPGTTRERKKHEQTVLSQDLKARCSLVFNEMWKKYNGNFEKIKMRLPKVLEATLSCYAGDCSKCRYHSYVCGGGHSNSWWLRSMFLGTHKLFNLNMNENDMLIMQELLKMKLSEEALLSMRFNFDTQKCEAVNRSLSVSCPKNVNFSRTFEGRASATIHCLNNGLATSIKEKVEYVGGRLSLRSGRCLEGIQNEIEQDKIYQKKPQTKKTRLQQRGRKTKEHIEQKQSSKLPDEYRKGQLDPQLDTALVRGIKEDHRYQLPTPGMSTRNGRRHQHSSTDSDPAPDLE